MSQDIYKPHTYSIGFRVTNEMYEDEIGDIMNETLKNLANATRVWMDIRMSVDAGLGLSADNAKFLLQCFDETTKQLAEKPAPPMLNSVRRWLAAKITPARDENDYDY